MKIINNSGFIFKLNEDDSTASIVKYEYAKNEVIIPSFIENENKKYFVTTIESDAISNKFGIKISFSDDSEVKTFKSRAFYGAIISIEIPKSLENYDDSIVMNFQYCKNADPHIYVSKDNHLFSSPDNKILYGKSQIDIDYFDTLLYVTPDVKETIISPTVKIIKDISFLKFQSLKFTDDSQIETIGTRSRFDSLTKIYIPQNLQNFGDFLFQNIKEIEVSPSNTRYKYLDNKYLLKKSDINKDDFDELVWVNPDVKDIIVPKSVKKIYPYIIKGFDNLSFEEGSQIEIIESDTIDPNHGLCMKIVFPRSVKLIKSGAVMLCVRPHSNFNKTVIFESEEITIEKSALFGINSNPFCRLMFPNAKKIIYNDCVKQWFYVRVRRDAELKGTLFEENRIKPQFYGDVPVSKEKLLNLFEYVRSIEKQLGETKEIKPYDLDSMLDPEIEPIDLDSLLDQKSSDDE